MKKFLFVVASLLMMGLQINAQGIVVNKTDGTKVYYPAEEVESVAAYGYGEEPQPESDDTENDSVSVEAIDLGLPSGTKWANMNVGAKAENDYGLFFAWGETVGYSSSNADDGRLFNWASYKWMTEGKSGWQWINKYQYKDYQTDACWYFNGYFVGDSKKTLIPEDDAAHVNWGGDWYMPTYDEIEELLNNTTSEWTTLKDVQGRKFISKTNGNSIFLPAAGYRSSSSLDYQGTRGYYWSSSLYTTYTNYARYLYFNSGNAYANYDVRFCGRSVRPVLRK